MFEYFDKNAVFGVIPPDSPLWAPVLGLFAFTGIPMAGTGLVPWWCSKGGVVCQLTAVGVEAGRVKIQPQLSPRWVWGVAHSVAMRVLDTPVPFHIHSLQLQMRAAGIHSNQLI